MPRAAPSVRADELVATISSRWDGTGAELLGLCGYDDRTEHRRSALHTVPTRDGWVNRSDAPLAVRLRGFGAAKRACAGDFDAASCAQKDRCLATMPCYIVHANYAGRWRVELPPYSLATLSFAAA